MIQNPNALGLTTLVAKRYFFICFLSARCIKLRFYISCVTGPVEGFFCGGRESVGTEGHLKGQGTRGAKGGKTGIAAVLPGF